MTSTCHNPTLRAALESAPCAVCGGGTKTELMNADWCLSHAFVLCSECRRTFNRMLPKERHEFGNEQNLKALRRWFCEACVGYLPLHSNLDFAKDE